MDQNVTVIDLHSGEAKPMPLAEAADLLEINAEEIEWALEEHGECTTEAFNIVMSEVISR